MVYSHSQIGTYQRCQLHYAYKYVLKYDVPKESSPFFVLGNAVHDTLEWLYRRIASKIIPSLDNMQSIYDDHREQEMSANPDLTAEQMEEFYTRGKHYIHRYHGHYHPFDQAIPMAMEKNIHFLIGDAEHRFRGKVDRLDVSGHDLTIIDYKTSRQRSSDQQDTYRTQITLYAKGLQQEYGTKIKRMFGKVVYLQLENEVEREITDEEIQAIETEYSELIDEIESKKAQRAEKQGLLADGTKVRDIFPLSPSESNCRYCPFKQICPQFSHLYGDSEELTGADLADETIQAMVDQYAMVYRQLKTLEKQKKRLGDALVAYAEKYDHKRLYGQSHSVGIRSQKNRSIPSDHKDDVRAYLRESGVLDDVSSINARSLSSYINAGKLDELIDRNLVVQKISAYPQGVKDLNTD